MKYGLKHEKRAQTVRHLLSYYAPIDVVFASSGSVFPCWLWNGRKSINGYGRVTLFGKERQVHIVAWLLSGNRIPKGHVLDHKCRNRPCFNPYHLEAVSPRENTLRGIGPSARNASKTHCHRGHVLPDKPDKTGRRRCNECRKVKPLGLPKAMKAKVDSE